MLLLASPVGSRTASTGPGLNRLGGEPPPQLGTLWKASLSLGASFNIA